MGTTRKAQGMDDGRAADALWLDILRYGSPLIREQSSDTSLSMFIKRNWRLDFDFLQALKFIMLTRFVTTTAIVI